MTPKGVFVVLSDVLMVILGTLLIAAAIVMICR